MGLEPSQKADLLREMVEISAWVLRQVGSGRDIVADGPDGREVLCTSAIDRHRSRPARIALDDAESVALARLLAEPPPPAWDDAVRRALEPGRAPPHVRWKG